MERINWVLGIPREAVLEYARWREAVEHADGGDSTALVDLLRSDSAVLGHECRLLVADLLERHRLARKPGRQATPAYRLTPKEARIANLKALFRYFRRKGQSLEEAVQSALREEKREAAGLEDYSDAQIDEMITEEEIEELQNAVGGRRGSTRRMDKRRKGNTNRP
ncbi:hypothetical protein ACMFL9_27405 [Sinorhizobium meliloti]